MSTGEERPPTEEEMQAAFEEEMKRVRVEEILLQSVVSLLNLGVRRAGVAPGTEDEHDPAQARTAIEAVRALLPIVEQTVPEQAAPIRDALSRLQMAFVQAQGGASGMPAEGAAPGEPTPGESPGADPDAGQPGSETGGAGPAQQSGRLWVPGS